eukprot:Em0018g796a
MRTEVIGGSQRLVLSLFTVNSAIGVISPGQSVVISVECVADKAGKHEEDLCVEISDRHKNDPQITYKIRGEVLIPAINCSDIASVFEEHRICKQLGALGQHTFHEDGCIGVYGEEDETFVYKSVKVARCQKLQHPFVLAILKKLIERSYPMLEVNVQLELKKSLVDHLVQLFSCGHVLPVVDYIDKCFKMETLDHSLVRHFVSEVLNIIEPPYSRDFVSVFLPLVQDQNIGGTLQTTADSSDLVSAFLGECSKKSKKKRDKKCAENERRMRETTNAEEEKRTSAQAQSERRMREITNAEEEKRRTAQAQEQAALAQQKSSAAKIELENKRLQVRKDQNKAETEKHEQLQVNKRMAIEFEQKQIRLTEEAKQKTHNAEIAKLQQIRRTEEVKQKTHNAEHRENFRRPNLGK